MTAGDYRLGWNYEKKRKFLEAIHAYKKVIEKNKYCDEAYNGLIRCYVRMKKQDEAMDFMRQAVALNPLNSEAYIEASYCAPVNEVEGILKKALEINRNGECAITALAGYHLMRGNLNIAKNKLITFL